jgi:gliding motility associated protien GldN
MRHTFVVVLFCFLIGHSVAQPPARIREAGAKKSVTSRTSTSTPTVSQRAELEFPSAAEMPEDVSWRRDIYRVLDLTQDKNATLYYPEEPQGDRMNLFTYLFKLIMRKQINVYNYTIDGKEDFSSSNVVVPKNFLERNHIRFEERGGKFRIEDSDIPSAEVTAYYIKESTYFDQHTATFHTQVVALCPVRKEMDEFGAAPVNTPLFWVKYADVAPLLSKLSLNGSNYNNASIISADDYFTTNQYEGKIYKTNNLQGKVLANYCKTDSDVVKEQKKIESELVTFENHVWGNDSVLLKKMEKEQALKDSLAGIQTTEKKTARKTTASKATSSNSKKTEVSNSSRSQTKRQKSAATYSVRRQRH